MTKLGGKIETLAVVGATGAVGRILLRELEERDFPYTRLKLLASARSVGSEVVVKGKSIRVELLEPKAFEGVDVAIASTPDEVARDFVPWARGAGTIVVDESGYWRMDPEVPLVIPEVNREAIKTHKGLIASPNCSTTQMVVALKPLFDAVGLKRVVVSSYQAVSGAGLPAMDELRRATEAKLGSGGFSPSIFAHDIAFNLIPQIGSEKEAGFTSEEMKLVRETHKILGDSTIEITATCVRVPVMVGHSEMIWVQTKRPITVAEARVLWEGAPGIKVVDDLAQKSYPMPVACADRPEVFVGRIRQDLFDPCGLVFWCVSDNLRKGAATNAVQIAEALVR